jgi:hypothetical protein
MTSNTKEASDVLIAPTNANNELRRDSEDDDSLNGNVKKKGKSVKAAVNFLFNPRKRTVLGRDALNWGKLKNKY